MIPDSAPSGSESIFYSSIKTGADPALVVGGDANSLNGGADPIYLFRFSEKTHEILKQFGS